jgi:glycosyltransferase involved in cell wall biosynthesis
LVLVIHGIEAWQPSRRIFADWVARRVDSFIAVSRFSAEKFARWSGVPMDRAFILPNCVDLDRFKSEPRDPILLERYGLKSSKVLLTVGRLVAQERYKGFDEVIEAMPQLLKLFPTLKYLIVGDGDDQQRLAAKVAALRLMDHVIFTGRIAEAEKVAHYNLADVYVMPSSGEGFGIVLIEAAACGLSVIGSSADGSKEALLGGRLGQVINPRDEAALVQAISTAIAGESPKVRLQSVEIFSVPKFRERVGQWMSTQVPAASCVRAKSNIATCQ